MAAGLKHIDPAWAWSPFEPDKNRPWNIRLAAHLYRRAGFAANSHELEEAVRKTPAEVVRQLTNPKKDEAAEQDLDDLGKAILARRSPQSLSAWWLYRMLHTQDQLLEKTTLFWHGHFATSAAKVDDAKAMMDQHELLRRNAMGDFKKMVHAISRDPAMLIYLDSTENKKTQPNENYARELMELFCLGLGNYTEKDIQEIARCFTGWEVRRGKFVFNKYQHDKGEKAFLGRRGRFGGEDAIRIVVAQDAAPRFIVEKLIRYFVFDEPRPPAALIEPQAPDQVWLRARALRQRLTEELGRLCPRQAHPPAR
ncbi:MAG: DUF1800 family protein, partial [Planctomycetes bacterium]|nr:DUF1800 family protein [Planctomycetota bacterium]